MPVPVPDPPSGFAGRAPVSSALFAFGSTSYCSLISSVLLYALEAKVPADLVVLPKPLLSVEPYAPTTARKTAVPRSPKKYTPTTPPTQAAPIVIALSVGSSCMATAPTRGIETAGRAVANAAFEAGALKAEAEATNAATNRVRIIVSGEGLNRL